MKKILSFLLAGIAALCLISCSGDLHDFGGDTVLKNAGIIGTITNWSPKAITIVDSSSGTYEFTASADLEKFSIQETSGLWTTRWCGTNVSAEKTDEAAAATVKLTTDGVAKDLVYSSEKNPEHAYLTGLTAGSVYIITIKVLDAENKKLTASLSVKS